MMPDLLLFQSVLLQVTGNACVTSGLKACLAQVYLPWFGFSALAAVAVLIVLAFIYGISPLIGRSDMRAWVKVKIYDVILSLILILIFLYVAGLIYNTNVNGFKSNDLVSPSCQPALTNIYSLSVCDMYQFNLYAADLNSAMYYFTLASGTLQSTGNISWNFTGTGGVTSFSLRTTVQLLPKDIGFKYLGTAIDLIYGFVLANDVQLIILSASALIFAIFMSLGLVARIFGITRTFGGAMIAFALGLGLLYPLLVSINYGFIDYGLSNVATSAGWSGAMGVGLAFGPGLLGHIAGRSIVGIIARIASVATVVGFGNFISEPAFIYAGLTWIGLTFMPLITLVIVDVFIVDFSQAIGERMSLLSMLERIL